MKAIFSTFLSMIIFIGSTASANSGNTSQMLELQFNLVKQIEGEEILLAEDEKQQNILEDKMREVESSIIQGNLFIAASYLLDIDATINGGGRSQLYKGVITVASLAMAGTGAWVLFRALTGDTKAQLGEARDRLNARKVRLASLKRTLAEAQISSQSK